MPLKLDVRYAVALLSIWPTLEFINQNKFEQDFDISWLIILSFTALVALTLIYFSIRVLISQANSLRFFILLSIFLCIFQFYYDFKVSIFSEDSSTIALFTFIALLAATSFLAWHTSKSQNITSILAVFALVVISFPLASIINDSGSIRFNPYFSKNIDSTPVAEKNNIKPTTPNVYFFIFDGYTRSDILIKYFGYDNNEFTNKLKKQGFVIAKKSRSNFPTTRYSLNLTLNPSLIQKTTEDLPKKLRAIESFTGAHHSEVEKEFRTRNYNIAMMNYLGESRPRCEPNCITTNSTLTFSQIQYLKNTPIYDFIKYYFPGIIWSWLSTVANDNRYPLENMPKNLNKPFFLFSHALMPHPPYALDKNCQLHKSGVVDFNLEYKNEHGFLQKRYLDQISCANQQMLEIVEHLNSTDPSAIILFVSDHGWKGTHALKARIPTDPTEQDNFYKITRISNFMSIRAPKQCLRYYNDNMTLIDSFPFIFACLDNEPHTPSNARSFYVVGDDNNKLQDVTNIVKN